LPENVTPRRQTGYLHDLLQPAGRAQATASPASGGGPPAPRPPYRPSWHITRPLTPSPETIDEVVETATAWSERTTGTGLREGSEGPLSVAPGAARAVARTRAGAARQPTVEPGGPGPERQSRRLTGEIGYNPAVTADHSGADPGDRTGAEATRTQRRSERARPPAAALRPRLRSRPALADPAQPPAEASVLPEPLRSPTEPAERPGAAAQATAAGREARGTLWGHVRAGAGAGGDPRQPRGEHPGTRAKDQRDVPALGAVLSAALAPLLAKTSANGRPSFSNGRRASVDGRRASGDEASGLPADVGPSVHNPSVHIGTVEVRVTSPSAPRAPGQARRQVTRPANTQSGGGTAARLSRASYPFGIRQG
jgi:hypothetical protein